MKSDFMTGRLMVNLDSEDEGEIFVSCAGGCRTLAQFDYKEEALPAGFFTFSLAIKGLTGGHSGDDIDKGRINGVRGYVDKSRLMGQHSLRELRFKRW